MERLQAKEEKSRVLAIYKRMGVRILLITAVVLFVKYLLLPNLMPLMPFILALISAMLLNPLLKFIQKKFKVQREVTSIVLIILVIGIFITGMYFFTRLLITEAQTLSVTIQREWPKLVDKFKNLDQEFKWLENYLPPIVMDSLDSIGKYWLDVIRGFSSNFLNYSVRASTNIIGHAGKIILAIITFFLALYFSLVDYHKYSTVFKHKIGHKIYDGVSGISNTTLSAVGKNIKAQIYLALYCFVYMLVCFLVAGRPYALLSAFFIALVDVLPILGAGAVVIPWGIIELILGHTNSGIFLLVIGVVFFLSRRIIEPKLIGQQTGLHPLVTLMSLYVGLHIFGVIGGILAPTLVVICIHLYKAGFLKGFVLDLKDMMKHIFSILQRPSEPQVEGDVEIFEEIVANAKEMSEEENAAKENDEADER